MFLSRMVSGLICSKNHNKNNQANQPATKSPKSNKKNEKCKRSLSKTNSKLSISDLLKSNVKENQTKETNSTINSNNHNSSNSNNNNSSQNTHNNHHNNIGGGGGGSSSSSSSSGSGNHNSAVNGNNNNIKPSTNKPPTKVKSGSWKRSEKQISSYNTISGKKSKSLRKRSPTWLKFPNSPVKIAEKVSYVGTNDTTSVCRPGTLYSDVLFGAGSSCLVKIKTLTPRRNTNNAQKKLTKALIKSCKSNENETASGSETETDRELFPSLSEFNKSPNATTTPSANNTNADNSKTSVTTRSDDDDDVGGGGGSNTTDDGADVVILSETSGIQNSENGFNDVSYGSYLEHHFSQVNGDRTSASKATTNSDNPQTSGKPFTIDIPQWNFMDADISSEAYPKFLCQFEDEHYLKAEKMALLGLKLALGNNTNQGKFKF